MLEKPKTIEEKLKHLGLTPIQMYQFKMMADSQKAAVEILVNTFGKELLAKPSPWASID